MSELPDYVEENSRERRRMAALIMPLSENQLAVVFPNRWTVAVALAHLAFWDLRMVTMLKRWLNKGVKPAHLDAEAVNEALSVISAALTGSAAVKLALEGAEAIDNAVAKLTPAQAAELMKIGFERALRRSLHRKEHLDKIAKALNLPG